MIELSARWQKQAAEARVGVLCVVNVSNLPEHPGLVAAGKELEEELRELYDDCDRQSLRDLPVYSAYDSFYRNFRKTYHVQLQLESVVLKGKSIQFPSALVGAMFLAELKTGLLTAAHDLAALELPLTADVAQGNESYQRLGGENQVLKAGDLFVRDGEGVISSVIYGPDHRTRIQPGTNQAVFTTYGPSGISRKQVLEELEILEGYLRIFAPQLERLALSVS